MAERAYEVVVVGAGPAGLAASLAASEGSIPANGVALLDENSQPGGQIYRASGGKISSRIQQDVEELDRRGVVRLCATSVVDAPEPGLLVAMTLEGPLNIRYRKLVLAVGARELFLPYPGWTLPNVMGVGGLQALVKSGLDVRGKRIVVAGSGPLLLAVAAYLRDHGAVVPIIAEQAGLARLAPFLMTLANFSSKWGQAVSLMAKNALSLKLGAWIEAVEGSDEALSVSVCIGGKSKKFECDYVACSYGFVPNLELPRLIGCKVTDELVEVDVLQQTSVRDVYCVGEPTGIGGVELSVAEGKVAGYAISGIERKLTLAQNQRASWRGFASDLGYQYALRMELFRLAKPETIICRCEDVRFSQLTGLESARTAKIHTRCGMGACQGRMCGPATQYLFGWEHGTVRPPLSPVPLSGLESQSAAPKKNSE